MNVMSAMCRKSLWDNKENTYLARNLRLYAPKYNFPLCSRHREKLFKTNLVFMLKASKAFQQFICSVWVNTIECKTKPSFPSISQANVQVYESFSVSLLNISVKETARQRTGWHEKWNAFIRERNLKITTQLQLHEGQIVQANFFGWVCSISFCISLHNPSFSSVKSEYLGNDQLRWNDATANFINNSESNVMKINFFTKNILQLCNTWKGLPEELVLIVQTATSCCGKH